MGYLCYVKKVSKEGTVSYSRQFKSIQACFNYFDKPTKIEELSNEYSERRFANGEIWYLLNGTIPTK